MVANPDSPKLFHDELYACRMSQRLPRKTVAARAGIDASYLAALERGSRSPPSHERLEKIFDALGVNQQEKERLGLVAFFTRMQNHVLESAPSYVPGETIALITSIGKLTQRDIRIAKSVVDTLVANKSMSEAPM